jgi:hypothetical protein
LVSRGYWDAWHHFAGINEENKEIFDTLARRIDEYGEAALEEKNQAHGVIGNPITDRFSHFLSDAVGIDIGSIPLLATLQELPNEDRRILSRVGHIRILASLTGSAIFHSYYEITAKVLSEAGLISDPIASM